MVQCYFHAMHFTNRTGLSWNKNNVSWWENVGVSSTVTSVLLEHAGVSCTVTSVLLEHVGVSCTVTSVLLEHVGVSCTVGCYVSTV